MPFTPQKMLKSLFMIHLVWFLKSSAFYFVSQVVSCGSSVVDDNHNHGNYVGNPSPDANFLILVTEPTRVTFSTCSDHTNFDTFLRLYDECPGLYPEEKEGNRHNLTVQKPDFYCSYLHPVSSKWKEEKKWNLRKARFFDKKPLSPSTTLALSENVSRSPEIWNSEEQPPSRWISASVQLWTPI